MKGLSDAALDRLRRQADLPEFDERYQLVRLIGSGGMGKVYLAQDSKLDRGVALKVLAVRDPPPELVARLFREARIIARLEHPGIVPIHDVGELPDGRPFFTMKYVQGKRLDHYAKEAQSRQDSGAHQELLRCFLKLCETMAFAHAHGVIHRDLKPQNIMIGLFGEVLVMDWGIGKIIFESRTDPASAGLDTGRPQIQPPGSERQTDADHIQTLALSPDSADQTAGHQSDDRLAAVRSQPGTKSRAESANTFGTGAGTILGTPAYMAPEQGRGLADRADRRADVFALGTILRFLISGNDALANPAAPGRLSKIWSSRTVHPRPLAAIWRKAMSEDPDERYADAGSLSGDVAAFLDGLPVSAYRENLAEAALRWIRRNRTLVFLVLAYLAMRLLVFLWVRR